MGDNLAGVLEEREDGYVFTYTEEYRRQWYPDAIPISKNMPVREAPYFAVKLFPFFDSLIPERSALHRRNAAVAYKRR